MNALARGLMQFRGPEWKALGLRVQDHLSPEPAMVVGVEGQIEEVLLSLLVAAEQSATRSAAKTLEVTSGLIAGRVVVEIHYPEEAEEREAGESDAGCLPGHRAKSWGRIAGAASIRRDEFRRRSADRARRGFPRR